MEVKNCPKCGKIFTQIKDPICPSCLKQDEEDFQKVRDFLKEYPKSTMSEIVQITGVSAKRINKYLRDGRLEITEGISEFLTCLHCGKPITTGRFCRDCATSLANDVIPKKEFIPKPKSSSGPRMHTAKNRDE